MDLKVVMFINSRSLSFNNLSFNKFELKSQQDQNKWRHKLIFLEISENKLDRIVDLIIYENHYVLIKKLDVF